MFIHVIYSRCLFIVIYSREKQRTESVSILLLYVRPWRMRYVNIYSNQYRSSETLLPDVVVNLTIDQSGMPILSSQHTSSVAIIPNTLQKNSAALHRTSLCALNLCVDSTTNTTSVCCGFSRVFCHSSMKVDVSTTISGAFSAESYTRN